MRTKGPFINRRTNEGRENAVVELSINETEIDCFSAPIARENPMLGKVRYDEMCERWPIAGHICLFPPYQSFIFRNSIASIDKHPSRHGLLTD